MNDIDLRCERAKREIDELPDSYNQPKRCVVCNKKLSRRRAEKHIVCPGNCTTLYRLRGGKDSRDEISGEI